MILPMTDATWSPVEKYVHHGTVVHVKTVLKGKHREHGLCYQCSKFYPEDEEHCPIARDTYMNCAKHNLVTPVFECPEFQQKIVTNIVEVDAGEIESMARKQAGFEGGL